MATIPSNINRFQTSSAATRSPLGVLVTAVTPRRQPALRISSLFSLPKEPEDARLTGGTRSLDRRLLALNVAGSLAKRGLTKPRAADRLLAQLRSAVA